MSILRDIREYLRKHQHASLNDLSLHFDTSPDAMRGMLDQWVARGKVRHCPASACGRCSSTCATAPGDSYEWVN